MVLSTATTATYDTGVEDTPSAKFLEFRINTISNFIDNFENYLEDE